MFKMNLAEQWKHTLNLLWDVPKLASSLDSEFSKRGIKRILSCACGTGDFMIELYKLRESEELTKAEAVRRVQQHFIHGKNISGKDISEKYKHPFYWAPFVLMGSWL